ncbi:hypothetical protein VKT23_007815 [Stygiomarasmius scandens]|uniref:DUF6534 domain-containing protein n=1 Tax=Marasmiellus scandens TaxID=2682957 RepID=A0ABR1JJM7_9AGAR
MSSTPGQTPQPSLALNVGSILIAELFATFLFGIATMQTWIFFKTNKQVYYWNKFMLILIILSIVSNIAITVTLSRFPSLAVLVTVPKDASAPVIVLAVGDFSLFSVSVIDFILCISLFYALRKSGRLYGWTDSNSLALASYMVNTGCFASFFSLSCIVTLLLMRGNIIYQALRNVSTELYVVSFLAMVNAPYYFEKLHEKSRRNVYIGDDVTTTVTQSTSFSSRDSEALEMLDRKATINEIGLPLFNKRVSPILQLGGNPILEVNMTREERHAVERIYPRH